MNVAPEEKAKSAKTAMLTSRINTFVIFTNVTFNGNGAKFILNQFDLSYHPLKLFWKKHLYSLSIGVATKIEE